MDSEVTRLKQQIEQEYQAMKEGLTGLSSVARHQIIYQRYENIYQYMAKLEKLVGEEPARVAVVTIADRVIEGRGEV
ncbi:hypothetical protein EI42_05010 [Thermosporothrix hazakensis]|jgi:hypothetical protein|uniref:Uncharacterized protein n=2 Tax=Thermosporothrix TaxID=768650 RepID=A0A326U0Q8_THEHA|nr:hypothetical protein [Thermosporothrix hazakensis]PZW23388.1 hypothetical protein EI42_05010 [Thermosporothrix hazakensis]BBH89733.1 hypothetical protein KTC_44840 [Thermosporothrix sp. COM3]GCE47922.1 hypothetical protein KTH_27910 [Thermosporothrix hazakensis]